MPEIITNSDEIAECEVCGLTEFETIPHPELPRSPMAFCTNCGEGKALPLYQFGLNVGTISKDEFKGKFQLNQEAK